MSSVAASRALAAVPTITRIAAVAYLPCIYVIVAAGITLHGIPVLRHDWNWPLDRPGVVAFFWEHFSGWRPDGIGYVNPYQIEYLMTVPLTIAGYVFGPAISLLLYLLLLVAVILAGSRRLAVALGAGSVEQYIAGAFAVFNPWVYEKTVAGHYYMILAYGAIMWLLGDLWDVPRRRHGFVLRALFVLLTVQQLQFFLAAFLLVCAAELPRKRFGLPLFAFAVWTPVLIGLLFDKGGLLQNLYLLPWEHDQSVDPAKGALLFGYYARYADGVRLLHAGMWMFGAAALGGLFFVRTRPRVIALATGAYFGGLVAASGMRWFAAPLYQWVVLHVLESAVLRELYDIVAVCAYAMLVLAVVASGKSRVLRGLAAAGSLLLMAAWVTHPPARFWPPSASVPRVAVHAPENSRFLLLPALQPLRLHGEGSGEDYDSFSRGIAITPLNEYYPTFPSVAAISRYVIDGDDTLLRTLGVSRVIARPQLQSDVDSLRVQRPFKRSILRSSSKSITAYQPLLATTEGLPGVTSGIPDLTSDAVSVLDVDHVVRPIEPDRRCVNSSCGWMDARLAFWDYPEVAQGMGGVFTTSSRPLHVSGGSLLAWVQGTLSERGAVIAQNTHAFRWIRLPVSDDEVVCKGTCAVVLQAPAIPSSAAREPAARWRGVRTAAITPFLLKATVGAQPRERTLRFNAAFDGGWIAFTGGRIVPHVRLDAAFNGWILPATLQPETVWVVHWVAAVQAALECIVLAGLPALMVLLTRRGRTAADAL